MVTSAFCGDVLLEHDLVVHLVDMVAGQHDDVVDAVVLEDVDVLVDRVGGAFVPLRLRDALARRQDVEALVALGPEEVPAALQVADQAVRLVLGGDADAADAGVERVGEREVDDPGLAAEIDRGLGAAVGQLPQPRAAAAGEHEGERVAAEPARHRRLRHRFPPRINGASVREAGTPCQAAAPSVGMTNDSYYQLQGAAGSAAPAADRRDRDGDRHRRRRSRRPGHRAVAGRARPRGRAARGEHDRCRRLRPQWRHGLGRLRRTDAAARARGRPRSRRAR